MNLTDLVPYNNNTVEKHYHKSPQGLLKPITRFWRPPAIIILDPRLFSNTSILYCSGLANPCFSTFKGSGGDSQEDTSSNCVEKIMLNILLENGAYKRPILSGIVTFWSERERRFKRNLLWQKWVFTQCLRFSKNKNLIVIVFTGMCCYSPVYHYGCSLNRGLEWLLLCLLGCANLI